MFPDRSHPLCVLDRLRPLELNLISATSIISKLISREKASIEKLLNPEISQTMAPVPLNLPSPHFPLNCSINTESADIEISALIDSIEGSISTNPISPPDICNCPFNTGLLLRTHTLPEPLSSPPLIVLSGKKEEINVSGNFMITKSNSRPGLSGFLSGLSKGSRPLISSNPP